MAHTMGWSAPLEFVDETKLREVVDTPHGYAVIQRDLNNLEKGANRNS